MEALMEAIGHFINGKNVVGTSGREADIFLPMTGEVQGKVSLAAKNEVDNAIAAASIAQPAMLGSNHVDASFYLLRSRGR